MVVKLNHWLSRCVHRFAALHREEDGGAYTLSYVLVIPFLMLLVALIVESALLMSAKLGTVYAGFAAVRCASVHSTGVPWGETLDEAEIAAAQAMMPFASGTSSGELEGSEDRITRLIDANRDWVEKPASQGYLRSKWADTSSNLAVEFDGAPSSWDDELTATVTYRFPFHVPGLGQMIGEADGAGGYVFPIRTKITLQNDAPQNDRQELGIGYGSTQ